MGVNDFLMNYYGAYRNAADPNQQAQQNPGGSVGLKMPKTPSGGLGLSKPAPPQPNSGYGYQGTQVNGGAGVPGQYPTSMTEYSLNSDKNAASNSYNQAQSQQAQQVAQQYSAMAAGQKNTNQYGVSNSSALQNTDFNSQQLTNLGTITQVGQNALQATQNAASYQAQQKAINANAGFTISYSGAPYSPSNLPAGSTSSNKGAQAVAAAMTAYNNKTPYTWGGNDLLKGVDCSGLVQQAYAKLGIQVPRTTYEQAKFGHVVNGIQNALPGDLVFYNTGGSDPNGIGVNSHVAIYLGNGKVLEAENPSRGIVEADIGGYNGTIMRPW
jgi:cell wall-associated NlpC family hydrolase